MTPSPSKTAEEVIYLASLTKCGDPNDAQHIWCHAELARLRERVEQFEDLVEEEVNVHRKWLAEGKLNDSGRAMKWNAIAERLLPRPAFVPRDSEERA